MEKVFPHEADPQLPRSLEKYEMWKAAFTEFLATAFLVFTLTTTIISILDSHEVEPKLLVPIAIFLILFLFLMMTVPLSGGHMSPILTFIAALKGLITLARAAIYALAQCAGSITGFYILKNVMDRQTVQSHFCTVDGPAIALILEFVCTFVFLFLGVIVAFDKKRCKELGMAMVCVVVAGSLALAVFVSITVTGKVGYGGAGLNPAKCLRPALLQGDRLWDGHWVFWVGPFLLALLIMVTLCTYQKMVQIWKKKKSMAF